MQENAHKPRKRESRSMSDSQRSKSRLKVLFVDDDEFASSYYVSLLRASGFSVRYVHDIDDALNAARLGPFAAVVIDIMMPHGDYFDATETAGGFKTGIAYAGEIADSQPTAVLVALTNSTDADVEAWFSIDERYAYYYKGDVSPEEFPNILSNKINGVQDQPQAFIVHGHDHETARSLKRYLQSVLNLPEPIILAEKANLGMTIVEKIEMYAKEVDVVFALFTPDDFVIGDMPSARARQNVVLEFGYFLGTLGRRSGRAILLHKRGVELPSDLGGIICIDITEGIEAAGEVIQRELRGLFDAKRE
jgi:CheY-like chemotaxis protein